MFYVKIFVYQTFLGGYILKTIILTDSNCDLPVEYINKTNLPYIKMIYNYKGKEYRDDLGVTIPYTEYFNSIRNGEMPTTSQVNAYMFKEFFKQYTEKGYSIIYIGFSSALSGTFAQANIAKSELEEEYPCTDITLIDTKSISLGEGLLVYYAQKMLENGMDKTSIVNWIESNKLNVNVFAAVDSLTHLKRGGRISGVSATVGTILDIKPILNINSEGKLVPVSKVKGRKKSIKTLANLLCNNIINSNTQTIFIYHSDHYSDAQLLKDLIIEKVTVKDIIINSIGYSVGAHVGSGALAVSFIGKHRNEIIL